jgi:hypothetical protein
MTTDRPRRKGARVIRASELGSYVYCAHAWWLGAVEDVRPENLPQLDAGRATHERHGQRVVLSIALRRLAYLLLILAGLVGVGWLVGLLVG